MEVHLHLFASVIYLVDLYKFQEDFAAVPGWGLHGERGLSIPSLTIMACKGKF